MISDSVQEAALSLAEVYRTLNLPDVFAPFGSEKLAEIQQEFDLSQSLVNWYATAAPIKVQIPPNNLYATLVNPEKLGEALIGYGYRIQGTTKEIFTEWNADWLVIGGQDEYPAVALKASAKDEIIYVAKAVKRKWILTPLSDDLTGFLFGVAAYTKLCVGKYKKKITDEDALLKPAFLLDFTEALDSNHATKGRVEVWLKDWIGYWI